MKSTNKLIHYPVLILTLFFIGLLLLSAYSSYFYPPDYPYLAISGLLFSVFLVINVCFAIIWLFIRRRYVFMVLTAFLLCYPQIQSCIPLHFHTEKLPEGSFNVLSYNVMRFGHLKKDNRTHKNAILAYVKNQDVDILCMQEYDVSKNKDYLTQNDIDAALKSYPYRNIQKEFACYSKFPILSAKLIDCKTNLGAACYELKIGKDTVMLINCHLESNKLTKEDKALYEDMLKAPTTGNIQRETHQLTAKLADASIIRAEQARIIAGEISSSPRPYVVVCGDFNDIALSYTYRVVSQGLRDAFIQSGCGMGVSYNTNRFYFRIDHILTSKDMKVYNCVVDRSIKDSDHYPIKCYVTKS
jgi:endonuclease/exonuclease/phosphatase family metal-dependent hydrolase